MSSTRNPCPGRRAAPGRREGDSCAAPVPGAAKPAGRPERMHMNEDEPTPLHAKYFVRQPARPQGPLRKTSK